MKHLYGEFTTNQIVQTKKKLRSSIFFLLLCVDPATSHEYDKENIDINKCFNGLLMKIGGLNEILLYPPELVTIMSLLQAALMEYNCPNFDFQTYRKLILDAGSEVLKLREE